MAYVITLGSSKDLFPPCSIIKDFTLLCTYVSNVMLLVSISNYQPVMGAYTYIWGAILMGAYYKVLIIT